MSQNSNFKASSTNPGMQRSTLEQLSQYHCPFCSFQASAERSMQDHLLYHSTKSAHQCQHCSFSISTVLELDHHIQQHHLIKDQSHSKVDYRPPGGKKIRKKSAIFKCRQCGFVTKYKQELERHEILHKEKSRYQCRLCSYSVGTRFHLTRHEKDHHSANQNTPAPVEEISVEPITVPSEEQARTEPLTVPAQEVLLQEARAESPTLPPSEEVQLESVTQNKWQVESIKKGRGGSGLAPKPTRVVKASKLARFITAFKSFPRRKQHELLISQAKAAMKTKKPKPKETDVALAVPVAVPAVLNPVPNAQENEAPKAQEMATAAPDCAEIIEEETVESTNSRVDMKRDKAGSRKTEKYFCGDCEFSTLEWDWMKIHRVRHEKEEEFKCTRCNFSARSKHHVSLHSDNYHRNPPRAPLEVNKIKKESPVVSEEVSDIAAAPDRLKNSKEEPVESTRAKRMQPKPGRKPKEVYECSDCEYSTPRRGAMEKHEEMHYRKEEFKCDRCSFSASMKNHVSFHSNRYHRKPPATPPEMREVKKEQQFKEDPAVDER